MVTGIFCLIYFEKKIKTFCLHDHIRSRLYVAVRHIDLSIKSSFDLVLFYVKNTICRVIGIKKPRMQRNSIFTDIKAINNGQRDKYEVQNNQPAIIDRQTWNAVQTEINRREYEKITLANERTQHLPQSGRKSYCETKRTPKVHLQMRKRNGLQLI